ncbi:MAG: hypothetical protein DKINENOH_05413 [bacterium]|nr:hypothetical protein [bacterium]
MEYFGTVRGSVLGGRVKGFVGSRSNNPYNIAVAEGRNPVLEDPRLLFYRISTPQDTTPRWVIPYANNVDHGDFNGDGLTDFAVRKSVNTDRNDTVMVYLGDPTGIDTTASYRLPAEQERSTFGWRMCVGDLNNDGIDDLVITARDVYLQASQLPHGRVYVYYGGDRLKSKPDLTITGPYAGARLGTRCAIADFNGDGIDDLVVHGQDVTVQEAFFGYLNLYFGSAAPFDTVADLTSPRSYNTIVSGLAAFDANADGKTDLLWTYSDSLTSRKSVHIHYGGADFAERFQAGPDFIIPAPFGSGDFGNEIANGGDMNGDGDDDIVIAADGTAQGNGIVFVYTAGKALDDKYDAARGQSRQGSFGASIEGIGDINGDGYADVIVGAPSQPWGRYEGYFGIFMGDGRIPTHVREQNQESLPLGFALDAAYPNPVTAGTNIEISLSQRGIVEIKVYNVLGKEVMTLLNEERQPGQHKIVWNTADAHGQPLPAGVYIFRMRAMTPGDRHLLHQQTRKFIVIR